MPWSNGGEYSLWDVTAGGDNNSIETAVNRNHYPTVEQVHAFHGQWAHQ
jgi:hypothetical protein